MLFYEPKTRDKAVLPHDPFKALIAPRPIGWVTTHGRERRGQPRALLVLQRLRGRPPIIAFSSAGYKDSVTFVEETGQFVWNMPTYGLRDAMNQPRPPLPIAARASRSSPGSRWHPPGLSAAACAGQPCGARMQAGRSQTVERPARRPRSTTGWSSARWWACTSTSLHQGRPGGYGRDAADRPLRLQGLRRRRPGLPDGSAARRWSGADARI